MSTDSVEATVPAVIDPAVVVAQEAPGSTIRPSGVQDFMFFATTPEEMQGYQAWLRGWFSAKAEHTRIELVSAREELTNARTHKWRLTPFQKMVRDLEAAVDFYDKAEQAVIEGYIIMPNLPDWTLTTVAVRIAENQFPADIYQKTSQYETGGGIGGRVIEPDILPVGEGEYVDPSIPVKSQTIFETDSSGKQERKKLWTDTGIFGKVSLPVKFMKPQVLSATQTAMAKKIFDQVDVLPARKKQDPIVIGSIFGPKGKRLCCIISWFIDTRDL